MSRALYSFSDPRMCCSSFGSGHTCEGLFEVGIEEGHNIFNVGFAKAANFKPRRASFPFGIRTNGSYSTFPFQPLLRSGSPDYMEPVNATSYGLINGGFGFFAPYKGAFTQRHFSQAPRAVIPKNVACDGEGRGKSKSFLAFNKYWKQSKTLTHKKPLEVGGKTYPKSSINALKNDDSLALTDPLVEDGKKEVNLGVPPLKAKVKKKPQVRTKKIQEKSPVGSEEPALQASSRKVSQSKKSKSSKNDKLSPGAEASLNGNPLIEVSLEEEQSKGTTNKTRKRKPKIQAKSSVESDAVLENSIVSELPSKLKTSTSVDNKTISPLYPPSGKSVVVVESATKAQVIQGYLGDMFEVLPSYGHVRDLAARSGSVRPDDDFSMVWEVPSAAWTHLKSIKVALAETENLILASDPDREGEAIAWHIIEMLQQQNALPENINVARVVFNEITESSIKEALQAPRDIDFNLVHAYLARRALDYLIGFNISPLLWRKLPGSSQLVEFSLSR
ncbi:hypothetical protein L6452_08692 [Arctium lappa]|uniref:Uncharacterized protein n=1 Tax=Arctium lappa TaxID=4217 RepID=A0ACB9DIE8_ARCLA|nr:hypothetical protein L6452_08692 [Arctium lappa]